MKLFSTFLLTLTLIASSANAVLDPNNLPTEVPTDLQEKLVWGLIKLDKRVVTEALDAGANTYKIGPETEEYSAYGPLLFPLYKTFDVKVGALIEECKNNQMVSKDDLVEAARTIRKAYEMYELLIVKGVSVDVKGAGIFGGTMRQFLTHVLEGNDINSYEPEYMQEFTAYMLILARNLQALIDKYQPEVKA
jgi:hypothetical protein